VRCDSAKQGLPLSEILSGSPLTERGHGRQTEGEGVAGLDGNERMDEVVDERRGAHREWEIQRPTVPYRRLRHKQRGRFGQLCRRG
jgi:hypothetical protein